MDLHRIKNNQADWVNIPESDYNSWQKLASKTHSLITPGNLVTSAGLGLVTYGDTRLGANVLSGLFWVTGGRIADVFDGITANKTGTKSPLGEKYDAVADKIAIGIVASGIIEHNLVPIIPMTFIIAQNALNAIISLTKKQKSENQEMHSSKAGKMATASQWVTMGLYGISSYLEQKNVGNFSHLFSYIGDASLVPTVYTSVKATSGYLKDFK